MTNRFWLLHLGMVVFLFAVSWPLINKMVYWVTFWSFGWLPVMIMTIPLFFYLYRSRWLAERTASRCVRPSWVWRRTVWTVAVSALIILWLGGIGSPGIFGPLRVGGQPIVIMMQVVVLSVMIPSPYLWASLDQAFDRDRKAQAEEDQFR